MNKLLKKIWMALAILIILAAVLSSVFRSLTPLAKQYKSQVEHHLSLLLGQPVTIQSMETGWYWFEPVLKLKQVTVNGDEDKSVHLDKLLVGINLFKSVWEWQIQPGVLYLEDIKLILREKNGNWSVDGLSSQAIEGPELTPEKTQQIIVWLAEQQRLIVRHVSVVLHLGDGETIPISGLNISVKNSGGQYKIKGQATLDQTNASSFELLGDVQFNPYHYENTKGQIFFSANKIVAAQLQSLFPKMSQQFEGGKGSVSLWLDINKGTVAALQAQLKFKELAWRLLDKKKSQHIQAFDANLAWKLTETGWKLDADHIGLTVGGVIWPENKLQLVYDRQQLSYQVYVKIILIESLLSESIYWPVDLKKILKLKPQGILSDSQFLMKDKKMGSVLTRFDNLGWKGPKGWPDVHNLSGVLSWQPEGGHLELDSEHTSLALKGYPEQKLDLLNAALEWKELSTGKRVSIDRFVLSQKDLTLSAQGVLDDIVDNTLGRIQIHADFSGKNLHQWAEYLPRKSLKPKLYAWLTRDVQTIAEATGTLTINGLAKDFPFDKGEGEFSITSHASGVSLYITPKWPLITELEGYLGFKGRNLDVDMVNGNFQGVPVHQMNLRIDDVGKNKETLLIHGVVHGKAKKIIDFVMASPLSSHLSSLKMLAFKGLLDLNLELEVPLYPESDKVLAKGEIQFDKNKVVFEHQFAALGMEDLTGTLAFTDQGISASTLAANFLGNPLAITIQSVSKPKAITKVNIKGNCTVDSLKNNFKVPLVAYLKGEFPLNATMSLTDDASDFDALHIHSNLTGLSIDLPPPFGKTAQTPIPLDVELGFNSAKGLKINANYAGTTPADKLSIKAKVQDNKIWSFNLDHRDMAGSLHYNPSANLLSGTISKLYLPKMQVNKASTPSRFTLHPVDIPNLNLRINDFNVGAWQIGDVTLQTKSRPDRLSIDFCQIESPVYQIDIKGTWSQKGKNNHTKVQLKAHVDDLAKSLARWDSTPALSAGKGDMEFQGGWNNSLLNFSLASLDGSLYLKIKKGIITHLSPETEEKLGLGKLLSVLSLQTIPRRLQLDFSDLSHQGYSFDVFKGNFTLKKGIMSTQDSYLDGPVAYADMKGDLDLVRRLYDLNLRISPHITASLPIVATIAGGPVAGLAAWVANKIINQGMQRIIAYSYKISGPWNQPVVQQLSIVKKAKNT